MRFSIAITIGLAIATFSPAAHAIEVMCSEGPAECTIDNEFPSYECSCNGQPGEGSTGGSDNPWEGLSEEELLVACMEMLADACADDPGTGGETSGGTTDGTGPDTTDTSTSAGTMTSTSDSSASAGDESDSASTNDSGETDSDSGSNGSSSGGESSGGSETDKSGCSVGSHSSAAGLAVLMLLGLRRRRF